MVAHAWKTTHQCGKNEKRSMDNPTCHCCMDERVDLNHIFRYCTKARSFWASFAKDDFRKSCHILPFEDWLYWNLKAKNQGDEGP